MDFSRPVHLSEMASFISKALSADVGDRIYLHVEENKDFLACSHSNNSGFKA